MTTTKTFDERNRDTQDGFERHVFVSQEHTDTGAVVTVQGSGTMDEDVPVINTGFGFSPDDGEELEVFLQSDGSDASGKFAVMTLPRNKQRKWKKGTGGIQNPVDPDKAVEFNKKRTHVTEDNFAVGSGGFFEVIGGTLYIRGNLAIQGDLRVGGSIQAGGNISTAGSFIGPDPVGSGQPPPAIPGFEE